MGASPPLAQMVAEGGSYAGGGRKLEISTDRAQAHEELARQFNGEKDSPTLPGWGWDQRKASTCTMVKATQGEVHNQGGL